MFFNILNGQEFEKEEIHMYYNWNNHNIISQLYSNIK